MTKHSVVRDLEAARRFFGLLGFIEDRAVAGRPPAGATCPARSHRT